MVSVMFDDFIEKIFSGSTGWTFAYTTGIGPFSTATGVLTGFWVEITLFCGRLSFICVNSNNNIKTNEKAATYFFLLPKFSLVKLPMFLSFKLYCEKRESFGCIVFSDIKSELRALFKPTSGSLVASITCFKASSNSSSVAPISNTADFSSFRVSL